jgi:hypothetical protein
VLSIETSWIALRVFAAARVALIRLANAALVRDKAVAIPQNGPAANMGPGYIRRFTTSTFGQPG